MDHSVQPVWFRSDEIGQSKEQALPKYLPDHFPDFLKKDPKPAKGLGYVAYSAFWLLGEAHQRVLEYVYPKFVLKKENEKGKDRELPRHVYLMPIAIALFESEEGKHPLNKELVEFYGDRFLKRDMGLRPLEKEAITPQAFNPYIDYALRARYISRIQLADRRRRYLCLVDWQQNKLAEFETIVPKLSGAVTAGLADPATIKKMGAPAFVSSIYADDELRKHLGRNPAPPPSM